MKKIFLLPLIITLCVSVFAQDVPATQVPDVIKNAMTTAFPSVTELKWEKKKDAYKAGFKIGKASQDVWFDAAGKIVKHRSEIKKSELPAAVTAALAKNYATYKIGDCEKTVEGAQTTFKIELKSDAGKKKIHVSEDGKEIAKK